MWQCQQWIGKSERHLSPFDFSSYSHILLSLLSFSADFLGLNPPLFFLSCSIGGFVKTWLPFVLFLGVIVTIVLTLHLR